MLKAKEEAKKQLNIRLAELSALETKLKEEHYDFTARRWMADTLLAATAEQTAEYQAQIRQMRFTAQTLVEEFIFDYPDQTELLQAKKLGPLVMRRREQANWAAIGKNQPDGTLWTFKPAEQGVSVCHCPKEFDTAHIVEADCPNWRPTTIFQKKHTVGNIDCKACMSTEHPDNVDVLNRTKLIDYCPNFATRLLPAGLGEYLAKLQAEPTATVCYAGLVHSEIEIYTDKIIVHRRCDTCSFTHTETKAAAPITDQLEPGGLVSNLN